MKKLAIIGASYLQLPLINKASEMGIETHVFAWEVGDVGEKAADFFYPISITEKDRILDKCREIGIDGICSIASDLAVITVNYVAEKMHLPGNSIHSSIVSTNKHEMRKSFERNGDPSPKSYLIKTVDDALNHDWDYPVIIKPTDRSGSRGITKVFSADGLRAAFQIAIESGFEKEALLEEFVEGKEYSVECITYRGNHHFLALTKKYTTGSPHFIETGHLEPAPVNESVINRVKKVVFHALDSLEIKNGASHSEIKISEKGEIRIIEIGARMGGDFIGSDLVRESTGIDFTENVVKIAIGEKPVLEPRQSGKYTAVRFILSKKDLEVLNIVKKEQPEIIVKEIVNEISEVDVTDSSSRFGCFIISSYKKDDIYRYLPEG